MIRMYAGDANCGPVAIQNATGIPYSKVLANWSGGWKSVANDKGFLYLPNDTPADHFATLEKLGVKYRKLSLDTILRGGGTRGTTILLL